MASGQWSVVGGQPTNQIYRDHESGVTSLVTESGPDRLCDLTLIREAADFFLGEDQLSFQGDLEYAVLALDELGVEIEFVLQFSRQTGGSGFVVSNHAVLNRQISHG